MNSSVQAKRPVLAALEKQTVRDAEEVLLDGSKLRDMTNQDAEDIQSVVNGQAYLLSLNQCKLRTLEKIPFLPSIEVLELQDNRISDASGLDLLPDRCPNVQELLLSGNQIQELTSLAFIMRMPSLQNIELQMNPCTVKYPDYRQQLFAECGNLLRIDDVLRDGVKADSDAEDIEAEQLDRDAQQGPAGSVDEEKEREERRQALLDFYEKDVFDDDEDDDDFEQEEEIMVEKKKS